MNRRQFIKRSTMACAAVALLPGRLPAQAEKSAAPSSSGASGTGKVPDYAQHMLHSDMDGLGPDGKPTGQKATYTGARGGSTALKDIERIYLEELMKTSDANEGLKAFLEKRKPEWKNE